MSITSAILYNNGEDFFKLNGSSVMALTPKAAKEVCIEASKREKFVYIVEGGHWMNPGFRPDGSTRWDARQDFEQSGKFKENNDAALKNIEEDVTFGITAFMITLSK
ncbi:colicin transporter [Edaphovirga cremea]|uniref:colicin transporter n=1 Tax=Edaphovirga cremea TaxID=2267246 RepID=UPI001FE7527A|nr:colicin transporter [Edaphovirga cremea]